ncbi:MAG: response regulator [Hyphomicrobiaceae bacterium]
MGVIDGAEEERRKNKRNRLLKGAIIVFNNRQSTLPCVLRDMTDSGARLQLSSSASVPDKFTLNVELDGIEVQCKVAWRKSGEIGITFLAPPVKKSPKRAQMLTETPGPGREPARKSVLEAWREKSASSAKGAETRPLQALSAVEKLRVASQGAAEKIHRAEADLKPILIAEDDADDRMLIKEAFEEAHFDHPIAFVEDGQQLLDYVRGAAQFTQRKLPFFILLDLNMPRMDGRTALMHLKTDPAFKGIPVIVLTTSSAEEDVRRTYDLGVTAYVMKPNSVEGLKELAASLRDFWLRFVRVPQA